MFLCIDLKNEICILASVYFSYDEITTDSVYNIHLFKQAIVIDVISRYIYIKI